MQAILSVYSPRDSRQVHIDASRFTIGRSASAHLVLGDEGVSSLHASIHSDGSRVWILDEGSVNGTYVNGTLVPPVGVPLNDGAEISLGNDTTIVITFHEESIVGLAQDPAVGQFTEPRAEGIAEPVTGSSFPISLVAGLFAAVLLLVVLVVFASFALNRGTLGREEAREGKSNSEPALFTDGTTSPLQESTATPSQQLTTAEQTPSLENQSGQQQQYSGTHKLYLQMSPQEQMDFIELQARHISLMMGNRPYAFNDEVLRFIKQYLDGYAKRVGNNSTRLWAEDPRFMFARAREQYAPHIIRAFNSRGVPPVVGLYLVVVETEYHNIQSENFAGAAGLFQFIAPTARGYGVDPSERTNVAKMAPAAAAYMSDRIAEFGPDSMSVALAIAGYNRSPDSVRRDLADVLNSEHRERSFWTLVANSNKLDHYFQGENIKYVPKFFAAAIVGETPWAFGIQMQPLSTYTEIKSYE
ncbi:MAG TPA: FHA domain-containing protein [Pyrinomonadaceae bacterium]|nr:FHA domain-containing protein [Pyrinomonadaceae bacterium]